MRWIIRGYGLLLRCYPREFRLAYGGDMRLAFEARLRHAATQGFGSWMVVVVLEVIDVVRSAVRERRAHPPRRRNAVPHQPSRENDMWNSLWADIRYAGRTLVRAPLFAVTIVVTLAVGIGANTAIFSVVHAVLLAPLPYEQPDRLAAVWERNYPRNQARNVVSPANFLDWREQNSVFLDMAAYARWGGNLTGLGEPERIAVTLSWHSFFDVFGVRPQLGRSFVVEHGEPGQNRVAVLSHRLWQRRFGADSSIIGERVQLDGLTHDIIGVMPPSFDYPAGTEVWIPLAWGAAVRQRSGRWLSVMARLRDGVTVADAQNEMDVIGRRLEQAFPDFNTGWGVAVVGLRDQLAGSVRPALTVLLAAVAVMLLIACANVANLVLGRAVTRTKEMAIRGALGASRRRLVRQVFTENAVLSGISGLAGIAVAYALVAAFRRLAPAQLPGIDGVGVDIPVLAFAVGVTVLTGIFFGTVPALSASRADVKRSLQIGGRGTGRGAHHRVRSALVALEVALAAVLLIGAGLLIRSFERMLDVELGIDPRGVASARIQLPGSAYPDRVRQVDFFDRLLERVALDPSVRSVGAVSFLPLAGSGAATSFTLDDRPPPKDGESPVADVRAVNGQYFETMGITLLRGRTFDGTERPDAAVYPVVVNEATVQRFWPDESPLGKRLTMPWGTDMRGEVVGVVGDVLHQGYEVAPRPMLYWAHAQFPYSFMYVVARTDRTAAGFLGVLEEQVWALDPDLAISDPRSMDDRLGASVAQRRFNMLLLAAFAGIALLLAAVGVYGMMAYAVGQRRQEMGLRLALGATPHAVRRLVLRTGMVLTLGALAVGAGVALLASRAMASLVFGISPTDPVTYAVAILALAAVALVATYVPARRATGVDPLVTLRSD